MDAKERVRITYKIEDLLDNHCRKCKYRDADGTNVFCQGCNIGKTLMKYGVKLGAIEIAPDVKKNLGRKKKHKPFPFTKEEYLDMKERKVPDGDICKQYRLSGRDLQRQKRIWDLNKYTIPKTNKKAVPLTKEQYIEAKQNRTPDNDICKQFGVSMVTLNKWKQEQGLIGVRLPRREKRG